MDRIFSSVFGTRSSRARNHTTRKQAQLNNALAKIRKANITNNMDDFYRTKTFLNRNRPLTKWQKLQRKGGNLYDYLKHGKTRTNQNRIESIRKHARDKVIQKAINLNVAKNAEEQFRKKNLNSKNSSGFDWEAFKTSRIPMVVPVEELDVGGTPKNGHHQTITN